MSLWCLEYWWTREVLCMKTIMETCCGAKSQVTLLLCGMKISEEWKSFRLGFSKPRKQWLLNTQLEKQMGYLRYGTPVKSFASTLLLISFQIRYKTALLFLWVIKWESTTHLCPCSVLCNCYIPLNSSALNWPSRWFLLGYLPRGERELICMFPAWGLNYLLVVQMWLLGVFL